MIFQYIYVYIYINEIPDQLGETSRRKIPKKTSPNACSGFHAQVTLYVPTSELLISAFGGFHPILNEKKALRPHLTFPWGGVCYQPTDIPIPRNAAFRDVQELVVCSHLVGLCLGSIIFDAHLSGSDQQLVSRGEQRHQGRWPPFTRINRMVLART